MGSKYEYVFDPSQDTDLLPDRIYRVLTYSDMESGELESMSKRLRNTQSILCNLLVLMVERGLLNEKDWDILIGQG